MDPYKLWDQLYEIASTELLVGSVGKISKYCSGVRSGRSVIAWSTYDVSHQGNFANYIFSLTFILGVEPAVIILDNAPCHSHIDRDFPEVEVNFFSPVSFFFRHNREQFWRPPSSVTSRLMLIGVTQEMIMLLKLIRLNTANKFCWEQLEQRCPP